MSDARNDDPSGVEKSRLEVDRLCDQFEQKWSAGESPRIEDVLSRCSDEQSAEVLFRELLMVEIEIRNRSTDQPSPDEYAERFPEKRDTIADVFRNISATAPTVNQLHADETPNGRNANTATFLRPARTHAPPVEIPGYTILGELGRGGMGVVYKARQDALNRVVALKTIRAGALASEEEVQRFLAEAESAAGLDHPNIVPIHEIGEHAGLHYFSMGYVDGPSLKERLADEVLAPRDAATLVHTLARAVQCAHEKGIVHRDLKPANVLMAAGGPQPGDRNDAPEPALYDSPRITDFGLAKNISTDSGMTATGQVLGTPSFMPPEQAMGDTARIGPQSDVYALGAILYAALTGRPPFQAANIIDTLKQVQEQAPVSPRQFNASLDRDLETICLKCLEKDIEKRYSSAAAVADELNRYLNGNPIVARPLSRVARVGRWCARNKLAAGLIFLIAFLAVAGPTVAAIQIRANRELDESLTRESETKKLALQERDKYKAEVQEHGRTISNFVETSQSAQLLKDERFKPFKRKLLSGALAHYKRFLKHHRHDEAMLPNVARALIQVALISGDTYGLKQESRDAWQEAVAIWSRLVERHPKVHEYQRELADSLNGLGMLHLELGSSDEGLKAFRKARSIATRLVAEVPHEPSFRYSLVATDNNLSTVYSSTGRRSEALAAQQRARKESKRLLRDYPGNLQFRLSQSKMDANRGEFFLRSADYPKALAAYRDAAAGFQALLQREDSAEYRAALADVFRKMGNAHNDAGDFDSALAAYNKSLAIAEEVSAKNPTIHLFRHNLGVLHYVIGNLYQRHRQPEPALKEQFAALRYLKPVSDQNPGVVRYAHDLASAHNNIGVLHLKHFWVSETDPDAKQRHIRKAKEHLTEALRIRKRLVARDDATVDFLKNLANIQNNLGVVFRRLQQPEKAIVSYTDAMAIAERLVQREPEHKEHQLLIAKLSLNIANISPEPSDSLRLAERAIQTINDAYGSRIRNRDAAYTLAFATETRARALGDLGRHAESVAGWTKLNSIVKGRSVKVHVNLCNALARNGQHREAAALAQRVADALNRLRRNRAVYRFSLACAYSLSVTAARYDDQLDDAARKQFMAQYAGTSISLLKRCHAEGFFQANNNRLRLRDEPRLDALRPRDEFQSFARSIGIDLPAHARRPASQRAGAPTSRARQEASQ